MSSRFLLHSLADRIDQMARNNPTQPRALVEQAAESIRRDAFIKVITMIPDRFRGADITDAGVPADDIQKALMDVFQKAPDGKIGVIFSGESGCGKTYSAAAAVKWIASMDPERVVLWGEYPKVIQKLRQEFSDGSYSELGSHWDVLCNESDLSRGMIVLDDVGSSKPSDFELEKLFIIIDHRSNEFMPVLITTNVPPERFEDVFGQRISSRLLGYFHVIKFVGFDNRK